MPKSTAALPEWEMVLSSAARLQSLLPDAVLVGGTASAIHAEHRFSRDADHVLSDLRQRFDDVLAQLESVAGWKTARVQRPVQILGRLDGIETGVRQLGDERAARSMQSFDRLYPQDNGESPLQQLQVQLANALPYDLEETELNEYKHLDPRWHDWQVVKATCAQLSTAIFDRVCDMETRRHGPALQ